MSSKILVNHGFGPTKTQGTPAQLASLTGPNLQQTGWRLPLVRLPQQRLGEGQSPIRSKEGRSRLEGQFPLKVWLIGRIHIGQIRHD